ncbi:hypothetical protein B0H12DRAFT_1242130 [Mycena haematopus]|nr:hypothetical protein B0H12DRAFT_1242130 [Mycena haematopus]
MPLASLWIILATWAAGAAGLSINMTSPPTLPAGGTAVFVWAQDNITPNPSQFSLYIVPEGPEENVIDAQLVNAGTQLSGTVTMVVPPDTSLGVYQTLAYTGTDSPTVGTGPALWGDEINLVAAVNASSASQSSTGTSSSAPQPSNTGSQSSTSASPSLTAPLTQPSNSSGTNVSSISSGAASSGTGYAGGSGASTGTVTTKSGIAKGAIVGIVLALIFALLGIGLLLFYLRRKRQRARRRFSGSGMNNHLDPSVPLPLVTPFTHTPLTTTMTQTTQLMLPIREKDAVIGSFKSTTITSPTVSAEPTSGSSNAGSRSGSSSGSRSVADREHQEVLARLEREVQLLRAQQQQQSQNLVAFDDVPPPQYDTL